MDENEVQIVGASEPHEFQVLADSLLTFLVRFLVESRQSKVLARILVVGQLLVQVFPVPA